MVKNKFYDLWEPWEDAGMMVLLDLELCLRASPPWASKGPQMSGPAPPKLPSDPNPIRHHQAGR